MANQIVTVNVAQIQAPQPSQYQRSGAFVSQGATTLPAGTYQWLSSSASLTSILAGTLALTSITWASNVATATTTAPHGFNNGDTIFITISGASPNAYNVTKLATITGASTFTYPLAVNPGGSATTPGFYTVADVAELVQMNTTFWAAGSNTPVAVLELGAGSPAEGITALSTWITANPGIFYAYLLQREWCTQSSLFTFLAGFEATTSKTYFFCTATLANYSNFTAAM